jgi:hypothetical protein
MLSYPLQELCLAPVVAAGVDPVVVLEAAQSLAPRQALALLRYLAAWLRLHDQVRLPAPAPGHVDMLSFLCRAPSGAHTLTEIRYACKGR